MQERFPCMSTNIGNIQHNINQYSHIFVSVYANKRNEFAIPVCVCVCVNVCVCVLPQHNTTPHRATQHNASQHNTTQQEKEKSPNGSSKFKVKYSPSKYKKMGGETREIISLIRSEVSKSSKNCRRPTCIAKETQPAASSVPQGQLTHAHRVAGDGWSRTDTIQVESCSIRKMETMEHNPKREKELLRHTQNGYFNFIIVKQSQMGTHFIILGVIEIHFLPINFYITKHKMLTDHPNHTFKKMGWGGRGGGERGAHPRQANLSVKKLG